jgi:hypothetical protein
MPDATHKVSPGPSTIDNTQSVRTRAAIFQTLVEDCVQDKTSLEELLEQLHTATATHEEAAEYIAQARVQRRERPLPPRPDSSSRKATLEGLTDAEVDEFRQKQQDTRADTKLRANDARNAAVDAAGWAILREKVRSYREAGGRTATNLDDFLGITPNQSSSISASLVADVLHLATYFGTTGDAHLDKTYHLRERYSADKVLEILVTQMQSHPIATPLPRPVWRRIIQDRYIPFDKLFAAIDRTKDGEDEHQVVIGSITFIESDRFSARKLVVSEADWSRVYAAWEAAVIRAYPHRKTKLSNYRDLVTNHF